MHALFGVGARSSSPNNFGFRHRHSVTASLAAGDHVTLRGGYRLRAGVAAGGAGGVSRSLLEQWGQPAGRPSAGWCCRMRRVGIVDQCRTILGVYQNRRRERPDHVHQCSLDFLPFLPQGIFEPDHGDVAASVRRRDQVPNVPEALPLRRGWRCAGLIAHGAAYEQYLHHIPCPRSEKWW